MTHCGRTDQINAPSVYVIDLQTLSPLLRVSSIFSLQTSRVTCLAIQHSSRHHSYTFSDESAYSDHITLEAAEQQYADQPRRSVDTYRLYAAYQL